MQNVDIGGGVEVPVYVSGPRSHSWMAMVVLLCAAASLYLSYVFSYLYLWTTSPGWIAGEAFRPGIHWPVATTLALLTAFACVTFTDWATRDGRYRSLAAVAWCSAALLSSLALATEVSGHWQAGLRPGQSGYGAMVFMASVLQAQIVAVFVIMALFTAIKLIAGRLEGRDRATLLNVGLFGKYAVAQGLVGLLLIHGFPMVAS